MSRTWKAIFSISYTSLVILFFHLLWMFRRHVCLSVKSLYFINIFFNVFVFTFFFIWENLNYFFRYINEVIFFPNFILLSIAHWQIVCTTVAASFEFKTLAFSICWFRLKTSLPLTYYKSIDFFRLRNL